MTSTTASGKLADEERGGTLIGGFFGLLSGGWPLRYVLAIALALIVALPAVDNFYSVVLNTRYQTAANTIASHISETAPSKQQILDTIARYSLSWYYITNAKGKVSPETIPYTPAKPRSKAVSDLVELDGALYYDAVVPTSDGDNLHVGFYMGPLNLLDRCSDGTLTRTVPVGYALLFFAGTLLLVGLIESKFTSKPLDRLTRAARHLIASDEQEFKSAISGGITTPAIRRLSAVLKDVRQEYNRESYERIKIEHELRREMMDLKKENERLSSEYKDHLFHTSRDISERASKEAEEEFLKALSKDLDRFDSANDICQLVLDKLSNKYPQTVRSGVVLTFDKQHRLKIPAFIGFDETGLQVLKNVDFNLVMETMFARRNPFFIPSERFIQYGLATVPIVSQFEHLVFLPLTFENRKLGFILVPLSASASSIHEKTRMLKNVCDITSRSLHRVTVLQEELESARTDPLTGLYNKKFLFELVLQLQDRAGVIPEDHPITFLMIDGDHFKDINDTYGHMAGDGVLRKLAEIIRLNTRMKEGAGGRYKDYVIRYGGEEFLVVLENTSSYQARIVADRIKNAIEMEDDWPEGIINFTASQGMASFPTDARDFDELLKKADTSLYYVKQEMGRNNICEWKDVPHSFKANVQSSTVGGELGLFDPPGLLQSIASTMKTGVLTVKSSDNKQFWILYDEGKAIQARLGKYRGYDAIIEFIGTFNDGSFHFQERNKTGTGKLPKLHESFNLNKGLERMMMDGVLAVDNMNRAKEYFGSEDDVLVPAASRQIKIDVMLASKDPPSKKELEIINQMLDFMNEDSSLATVFDSLDDIPTPFLWHCAGLILQNELAKPKNVADKPKLLGSLLGAANKKTTSGE